MNLDSREKIHSSSSHRPAIRVYRRYRSKIGRQVSCMEGFSSPFAGLSLPSFTVKERWISTCCCSSYLHSPFSFGLHIVMSSTEPTKETMDRAAEGEKPHQTKVGEDLAGKKPIDEAKDLVGDQVKESKALWKGCCDAFCCCCPWVFLEDDAEDKNKK